MAIGQSSTILPGADRAGGVDPETRAAIIARNTKPLAVSTKCICVQSPCNCTQNDVKSKAVSGVSSKGDPAPKDPPSAQPAILQDAVKEAGELIEAGIDSVKKLTSGAVEKVVKPIADGAKDAAKGTFETIKDTTSSFLGGLNDTIRFGLIAIALALAAALVLGLLFLRK